MGNREYPKPTEYEGVRIASASSIEVSFYYQGSRCFERIKGKPTAANIKRIAAHRGAIIDAISNGTFDYPTTFPNSKNAQKHIKTIDASPSIRWYLEEVYLPRAEKYLKASSLKDYTKIVNSELVPVFGSLPITDLDLINVKEWVDSKNCGLKRINNILTTFRAALNEAVDDGYLSFNPIKGWTPKRKDNKPKVSDVDPFSIDEQRTIIAAIPEEQARNLFIVAFWTGLRTSELVALDWGDIDLQKGEIHVSKAMTAASKEAEDTKTVAGRRVIKILPDARTALLSQKKHTYLKYEEVFQHPVHLDRWSGDGPIRERYWRPALKAAKVRYRRPYQTRHTYASMMLSAGENLGWVANQMGHSDLNMIARVYGRWIPDADPEAGLKADRIFGSQGVDNSVYFGNNPAK